MAAISTEVQTILRELTTQRGIEDQLASDDPMMEMITKESVEGDPVVNVQIGRGAGGSATASVAAANSQLAQRAKFTLTMGDWYRVVSLIDKDIKAARGRGHGALVSHIEDQLKEADNECKDAAIMELYGAGDGVVGQLSAAASSTLTFTSSSDVRKIQKGMKLVFAATRTGALRDSGDTLTVLSTDPLAKTVTTTSAVSGISGLGSSDFVFIEGNAPNTGTNLLMTGWDGYIRDPASDGGAFFGYTRTNAPRALIAGTVSDQSAASGDTYTKISDGLQEVFANSNIKLAKCGVMINSVDWMKLSRDLTSLGIDPGQGTGKTEAGHPTLSIHIANLAATFYMSHYATEGTLYVGEFGNPDACKLLHFDDELCGYVHAGEGSGKEGTVFQRNVNAHEAMLARYSQLAVYTPSKFGRVLI